MDPFILMWSASGRPMPRSPLGLKILAGFEDGRLDFILNELARWEQQGGLSEGEALIREAAWVRMDWITAP